MDITVRHTLHDFADDIAKTPVTEARLMTAVVRDVANTGNRIAKADAKAKAGAVGKHYHKAFKTDGVTFTGGHWTDTYGPLASMRQGNMDFERGSGRQTTPHMSVAISHDAVRGILPGRVRGVYDEVFW